MSRLLISFSKTLKTKIFVYQTNFIQGILDFFNFNKYEEIISDRYFSTGKNLNIKKYTILGSLYSYRYKLNKSNKINKNLIILSQPPQGQRNFPREISMDYANTYNEFVSDEKDMFFNIKKIYLDNKKCHSLSKNISYDYYSKNSKSMVLVQNRLKYLYK